MAGNDPLYFLIAGEPSGDVLGAHLMRALRSRLDGRVRFAGIGGAAMGAEGLTSIVPIKELAIMGVIEVLPSARRILRRIKETVAAILQSKPVAVVTIDSAGFCHRVTEKIKDLPVRPVLIHYVAPMVWAWRPYRAKVASRAVDHLLTLLPFEPPLFERVKLPATYVGHPVVESKADQGDGPAFRQRHDIAAEALLLCVLPGSRRSEVRRLLPIFAETVAMLIAKFPDLVLVVPTVETVAEIVGQAVLKWSARIVLLRGSEEKFDAFAAADVGLAASGTVSLEMAMARLPTVIGYRILPATAWVLQRALRVRYVTLANILLNEPIVPELLQNNCTAENLFAAVSGLLADPAARQAQTDATTRALDMIGRSDKPPSLRAADKILELVEAAREPLMRSHAH